VRSAKSYRAYQRTAILPWVLCLLLSGLNPAVFNQSVTAQETRVSIEPRIKTDNSADRVSAEPSAANIRVSTDLVLIPVTVTDKLNRSVTGLEKEHFKLFEDKVEQVITHFASEDAPVAIGIVFDCSASMGDKLRQSREAVSALLKTANPEDEFFMVEFSDRAQVVVNLTQDSTAISNRLNLIQPRGRTALLDAIVVSLNEMRKAHNSRKALVIISDGGDNSSRYTVSEVKNQVREADVQIYAVGIIEPFWGRGRSPEELDGPRLLSEVAEQTGGRLFEVDNLNDLPDIASKVGSALRNQYVLGYSPSNVRRDGKYHRVRLKLMKPTGWPSLRASWRLGYYAPAQ
jgi:Ca-activated chloride channel family protein